MPKGSVFIETVLRLREASIRDRLISFDCVFVLSDCFWVYQSWAIISRLVLSSSFYKKKIRHEIVSRHLNK